MNKNIQNISCDKDHELGVEVLNFSQLSNKLIHSKNHDPFTFHKLRFYLILIVTKGTYRHFVDFETYDLKEGSILFIAENQIQHFTNKLTVADGISIVFDNSYFEKSYFFAGKNNFHRIFNYHIENSVIHQNEVGNEDFIGLAINLYNEFSFPSSNNRTDILYSLLKIFLLKADRIKTLQAQGAINPEWLETFSKFKRLVEAEYNISRSSRYYAKKLLIPYKSLNIIVKKATNKTPKVFIDDFVTIEIKRYLKSTSLSIKEISFKTGFEEATNLISFFKKNTGTTPLKFRKNI